MKKYTLEDFKNFERINGITQCPSGDYTAINEFPAYCSFGEGCRFGEWCSFGERCRFREGCRFGERCRFGGGCSYNKHVFHKNGVMSVGYIGSERRTTYIFATKEDGIRIQCGCKGDISLEEFEAAVLETHKEKRQFREEYLASIELIKIWSRRFYGELDD